MQLALPFALHLASGYPSFFCSVFESHDEDDEGPIAQQVSFLRATVYLLKHSNAYQNVSDVNHDSDEVANLPRRQYRQDSGVWVEVAKFAAMCGMDAPRKTQKPNQKKLRVNLSIQDDCIRNSSSTNGMLARVDFLNLTVTDYNNIFTRITVVYSTFLWHKVMEKSRISLFNM
jgi:hypothetical protein